VRSSNPTVTISGVLVHQSGLREDSDCYLVHYLDPAPGNGTFAVDFNPDPGNLVLVVYRGDCSTVDCNGSDATFESSCQSQGATCTSGNSNDFTVCVQAAAGQDGLCQPYTLRLRYLVSR